MTSSRKDRPSDPTGLASPGRAQALLAAIVESSDDAIISQTVDGVMKSWNSAAQRLFGYAADEAIGRPVTMLIPEDRKQEDAKILSRVRRGERIEHYETIRLGKDGRRLEVSVTLSPVRDEASRVVGASTVARDITLQKRAQRELNGAEARRNEFLALLADELISPLGPIRHAVKVLRARTPSPPADELEWATNVIDRQAEQLTRLVEDLLDFSRILRGTLELHHDRVEIAAVLKAAVAASRGLIERSRHQLLITPPPEPLYVDGDATRLAQIVSHLLANAAQHMDPGGQISLSAEREGEMVVIRVKDTGLGISSDVLPRVFEMFTQAEHGGLGVGLALVEHLVKLHGGTVTASSAGSGKGSQFVVRLHIARVPKVPAVARAQAIHPQTFNSAAP